MRCRGLRATPRLVGSLPTRRAAHREDPWPRTSLPARPSRRARRPCRPPAPPAVGQPSGQLLESATGWPGSAASGRTPTRSSSRCCARSGPTTPRLDVSIVERAYAVAEHFHEGQLRKSGDPYITHPLAVATILAELGMTGPTLAAALLHDTVEDTAYTHRRGPQGLRRRGRQAGRRRDQAGQGQVRRRGAGRDRPQDGRGDGPGHPGAGHQAGRPAAQRPHLALRVGGVGPAQGPRDARDLRAAGPPARHEHHQVGARGPLLRDALPQGLRRDRPAGRRPRAGPRGVPRRRPRAGRRRPARRPRSRRRSPAGRSTTTPSTRR